MSKEKRFYMGLYGSLGILAAVLLGLNLAQQRWAGVFTGLVNAPYEQLGIGLRWLSLRGGWADAAAWCLYIGMGLLPLLPLLRRIRSHRRAGSALFGLPVCAAVLAALYYMVNPGLAQRWTRMLLTGTADSLLAVWLTVWAMERLSSGSQQGLLQSLKWLLVVLDLVLVAGAFGTAPAELLGTMKAVAQANTGVTARELALTNGFLAANAVVRALPLVLDMVLVHGGLVLLAAAAEAPFSETTAAAARRLALTARWVVVAQAAAQAVFHLAQLAVAPNLHSTAVSVELPIFSIIFGVAAMILAQWISRGQKMQEENDSFI